MTVTIEKLENNEVKLDIEIGSETATLEYNKACKKLGERVNIPGFRPGKAPKNLVEKYVGIDNIQKEVLQSILPGVFETTIEENKFDIISQPNVEKYEFADDLSLKITAKLELRPEVKLGQYKGMEVEVEEYKNPDDVIDKELKILAEKYSELKDITDRKSVATDLVNIDFDGYVDGEQIKGGYAKNYILDLAHSNFIAGFAEQLVDRELNSEFTINVKFPDNYHDEKLQSKDAEFKIKLNGIKERVLHEINDELAKKVANFPNLDALKEDIGKYVENAAKMENEKRVADKIYDRLINETEINIQPSMINREVQAMYGEMQQRMTMQGQDFNKMLEKEGHEKVYAMLTSEATTRIKTTLIITEIARQEKIYIEGSDIEAKMEELARMYGTSTENIMKEMGQNPGFINSINQQILSQKVTKLLVENANVKYVDSVEKK